MQDGFKDKDIEFALHVLQHVECHDDREVKVWLEEKDHRELLEELRRFREAGMREAESLNVDENYQWRLLERRMVARKRKNHIRHVVTGVAAAITILIVASVIIYYQQKENTSGEIPQLALRAGTDVVKLITGKGEEYILASSTLNDSDTLGSQGIVIDSVGGLKYMRILHDTTRPEEFHTILVPRGGEYILVLDDGTRVWINSESELRYPVAFRDSVRKVYLKGEAYFEVKRDEKHPFVVETSELCTRVLGTEFNVQSYERREVNITLVEGRVAVNKNGNGAGVILKPGENASYNGDSLYVESVDVLKYVSWKEGFFYYNNVRLEDILSELGRWFDFTVFYQNPEVKDYRFKFWANRKDTVEQVLERLNETGKLQIEVRGKTVTVSL
ncbi:FecR family protein [uncultured Butyricimonas sp.]|uniref:FecR family protein n=1 Tax=uncultured Butyricimonas sp. TaxID=1268785 RepID=UPI0026DD3984|nr:FecR family protein [uncultured Butyricimonas sp.]